MKVLKVDFPYLENPFESKTRPVLQLTQPLGKYKTIIVAYVTSKFPELLESDVVISNFRKSGFNAKSLIRLHKIYSIPISKVKGEIGILDDLVENEVKAKLKELFNL